MIEMAFFKNRSPKPSFIRPVFVPHTEIIMGWLLFCHPLQEMSLFVFRLTVTTIMSMASTTLLEALKPHWQRCKWELTFHR